MSLYIKLMLIMVACSTVKADCPLNIGQLSSPQPIVLSAYTRQFLYPNDLKTHNGTIQLPPGEIVIISCPGGRLNLDNSSSYIYATCNTQNQLVVNGTSFVFSSLKCDKSASSYQITDVNCAQSNGSNKLVNVGFDFTLGFIPIVTVCFDFVNKAPIYVNYTIPKALGIARTDFVEDFIMEPIFYNLTVDMLEMYGDRYENHVYKNLLGIENDSYIFFPYYKDALGLTDEFFYESQPLAVSRDIFSWPQWRGCFPSIQLNIATRRLNRERQVDLEIHSGLLGISQLPHAKTQEPIDMFLYVDANIKAIPVPVLIWRLIYEPISKRAVVLVAVDNKNLVNAKDFVLCDEDLSQQLNWLLWISNCGYYYACTYEEFKRKVQYLPEYNVTGILL